MGLKMVEILIKLLHFTSTAHHSSTSKKVPFDQILSYHVLMYQDSISYLFLKSSNARPLPLLLINEVASTNVVFNDNQSSSKAKII